MMSKCDIKQQDYKFVELFDEYLRMRNAGEKYWYVVAVLAERYGISESSVKRIVRRLSREVSV